VTGSITKNIYCLNLNDDLFRIDESVTHVKIRCINGYYDVGAGKQFTNLKDFVEYYKMQPLEEKSGRVIHLNFVSGCACLYFLPCSC
jgi:hypothetical protein